ncbi:hypothetical protein LXL04_007331 [Taraxacum kok-saghyz]
MEMEQGSVYEYVQVSSDCNLKWVITSAGTRKNEMLVALFVGVWSLPNTQSLSRKKPSCLVVSLEEEVFDAIMLVKSYGFNLLQKLGRDVREGKRRQFSFIGKLLRDVEPDLMEGLIKAMKDSDFQKFQELSGASDKSDPVDITEVEEETGDEEEEEDEGRLGDIASRWFDGLVNKDIDITNEIYSLSTVEFDRQELRKLVRTFCSVQSATSATETETDVKVLKAKRQLTRFLLSLAKQLPTEENYIL